MGEKQVIRKVLLLSLSHLYTTVKQIEALKENMFKFLQLENTHEVFATREHLNR